MSRVPFYRVVVLAAALAWRSSCSQAPQPHHQHHQRHEQEGDREGHAIPFVAIAAFAVITASRTLRTAALWSAHRGVFCMIV